MHAFPQAPQWALEVSTSVSQVVAGFPSHSRSLEPQHRPDTHVAPIGQTLPHAPQLLMSLFTSRQMSNVGGVPVIDDAVHD